MLLASFASLAAATPPSPPVRLTLGIDSAKEATLPGDVVPIRLVARQADVTEIVVTATLTLADRPAIASTPPAPFFERRFEAPLAATIDIPIDLARGEQATLDVRMSGRLRQGGGFSDRLLRSLRREADGRLVLSRVTSTDAQRRAPGNR